MKERALTLEALRVLDAIDRRGSFALAAEELKRVPSALSYTIQKLEDELGVMIFDRSGHRARFTNVGRLVLERGRLLLEAADRLTSDAQALASGWEATLTIVFEALVSPAILYPLIERLAAVSPTQLILRTEVLAGAWERLEQGKADIVIAPDLHYRAMAEIKTCSLFSMRVVYVAHPDHPVHQHSGPLSEAERCRYRAIAVPDTAIEKPVVTTQLLVDKQPRLSVPSIADKREALLAGLGVASMPWERVAQDVAEGRLKVVESVPLDDVTIIMAWRRDKMGEAKAWLLREIPRLFRHRTRPTS